MAVTTRTPKVSLRMNGPTSISGCVPKKTTQTSAVAAQDHCFQEETQRPTVSSRVSRQSIVVAIPSITEIMHVCMLCAMFAGSIAPLPRERTKGADQGWQPDVCFQEKRNVQMVQFEHHLECGYFTFKWIVLKYLN